jgi:hypothetical protein
LPPDPSALADARFVRVSCTYCGAGLARVYAWWQPCEHHRCDACRLEHEIRRDPDGSVWVRPVVERTGEEGRWRRVQAPRRLDS